LFFTARIERARLHRARSASKKNGLPAPSHDPNAVRRASTGEFGVFMDEKNGNPRMRIRNDAVWIICDPAML